IGIPRNHGPVTNSYELIGVLLNQVSVVISPEALFSVRRFPGVASVFQAWNRGCHDEPPPRPFRLLDTSSAPIQSQWPCRSECPSRECHTIEYRRELDQPGIMKRRM